MSGREFGSKARNHKISAGRPRHGLEHNLPLVIAKAAIGLLEGGADGPEAGRRLRLSRRC